MRAEKPTSLSPPPPHKQFIFITDRSKAVVLLWFSVAGFFGVRVSVTFQLTCVHIISSSVWVTEWPPFGKLLLTRLTINSLCILAIYNLVTSRFGFEGWIWVLIASVPDLCILFTFNVLNHRGYRICGKRRKLFKPLVIYPGCSKAISYITLLYGACYKGLLLCSHKHLPGAVARSVACPLRKRAAPKPTLASGTFFSGKTIPSSADSRRASCQLLVQNWALNASKLPSGGLPWNSVV